MEMLVPHSREESITLKNGKKIRLDCTWENKVGQIVSRARVFIVLDDGNPSKEWFAVIEGPKSYQEAVKEAVERADTWFDGVPYADK
ncbi:hypothetical protein [Pseudomonas sp. CCC4.4]|uniref:hypothetical protein n=1 Tax=Pseudomonas sp. CCC4.4 TaxID=3048612 RepID=UPI002B225CB4|nr:hypothetical protein [Pseudomonas sp. CCC4.4]MEB0170064.1 hypothetical protein [Pseudomonas sp. CCC4.4]